jgi:hypothetical protein
VIPLHPTLMTDLGREREQEILRDVEQRRLITEAKAARTRSHASGWVAGVRTFTLHLRPDDRTQPGLPASDQGDHAPEAA